ncbi:hypothetical protein R1sor_014076 [Riccia sorocarpa]|uniref:Uncharacterized protein n=1 Tax=Riccia sorocarpa TaxID=122646 RepID=A0ABD3H8D2_9MARC
MNSQENSACGHQPPRRSSRPRKPGWSNASQAITIVPAGDPSRLQLSQPLAQDSHNTHTGNARKRQAKVISSDPTKNLLLASAVSPERTRGLLVDGESSPSFRQLLAQDSQVPLSSNSLTAEDGTVRLSQLLAEDSTHCSTPGPGTRKKMNSGRLDLACLAPHQENPKKTRSERPQKPRNLTIEAPAAGKSGNPAIDRLPQHNFNPVSGPPRFAQLLARDSEGSNPQYAVNPDTPSQTFDVPPAIRELCKQNPPEAPGPSKTSRTGDDAEAEPTGPEVNVRAKIIACLLDPNFQDLLSEVEKVWRELEVSMSDESQLAQAVTRRLKAASGAGPSNAK